MIYEVEETNSNEYDEYINNNGALFQKIEWFKSNDIDNYYTIMLKNDKDICIAGTYIFIKVDDNKCIYFPRGPIFSAQCTKKDIEELYNYLLCVAEKHNCEKIILDCKNSISNTKDIESWMLGLGAKKSIFSKFWHYNWGINLKNITINEYLKELPQKTRYNIRYAIKNGLKIAVDNSEESIKKFYKLHLTTSQRDGFEPKQYNIFINMFKYFKEDIKLFWVYKDEVLLSAAIYIIVGNQAYYLFGASSNKMRNYMPTYLMQYAMIEYSISKKCDLYNMGGIGFINRDNTDNFNEGLYTFKKRFGGELQDSSYTYEINI